MRLPALLTAALGNKNPHVQLAALKGLIGMEPQPPVLVPLLGRVMADGNTALVDEALGALASLGDRATPALIDALKRPETRGRAAALIARIGPKAGAAVGDLAAALADKDPEVRREVLFALGSMGAEAGPAQGAIVKALDDPEVRVGAIAAFALGRIGPPAKTALPQLRIALESADPVLRVSSAWALVHIVPGDEQVGRAALPVLIQGLQNPTIAVRRGAADALGRLGKAARAAEQGLRTATRDPDPSVRKAAAAALERIGITIDASPDFRLQRR